MDLKFTFTGGPSEHSHTGESGHSAAPAHGIPLPIVSGGNSGINSGNSELIMTVTISRAGTEIRCDALSGDGVSYASSEKTLTAQDPVSLAASVRSVLARTGAELPEPLITTITAVQLELNGAEAAVLAELGITATPQLDPHAPVAAVNDALQARSGISVGVPIRIARG